MKMHRLVNDTPAGMQTDHINGDRLDNRRENLRTATHAQNMQNKRSVSKGSRYKGITFERRWNCWVAQIQPGDKLHSFTFTTEEEAARAYDALALHFYGEFARTNFSDSEPLSPRQLRAKRPVRWLGRSQYRGVTWNDRNRHWQVRITINGKRHSLGVYQDEKEAARAWDQAALRHRGPNSPLNFPDRRAEYLTGAGKLQP